MTPTPPKQKIKALCTEQLLADPVRRSSIQQELLDFMPLVECIDMHCYNITEFKTDTFLWPTILNFTLPAQYTSSVDRGRTYCEHFVQQFTAYFQPHLDVSSLKFLWMYEYAFGKETNGSNLITSYYSWQKQIHSNERMHNMWVHFDMEREQLLYTCVHFNIGVDPSWGSNCEFDFVFESYIDDPDGIDKIYHDPMLHKMREHSTTFINTDTRRLAFGKVFIFNRG